MKKESKQSIQKVNNRPSDFTKYDDYGKYDDNAIFADYSKYVDNSMNVTIHKMTTTLNSI